MCGLNKYFFCLFLCLTFSINSQNTEGKSSDKSLKNLDGVSNGMSKKDSIDYYKKFSAELMKEKENRLLTVSQKKKLLDSLTLITPKKVVLKDTIDHYKIFSDNIVKAKEDRYSVVNQRKKTIDSLNIVKLQEIKTKKHDKHNRVVDININIEQSPTKASSVIAENKDVEKNDPVNEKIEMDESIPFKTVYDSAKKLYDEEDYEAALAHFTECIRRKYYDVYSIYYKGVTLRKMKRYDEAIETFRDLFNLDRTFFIVNFEIGKIHVERKEYDLAMYNFDQYLLNNPHSHEAHYYRGLIYFETNKHKQALDELVKAIKWKNTNADYYLLSGKIRLSLKSVGTACQDLQKAIDFSHSEALQIFNENCLKKL